MHNWLHALIKEQWRNPGVYYGKLLPFIRTTEAEIDFSGWSRLYKADQ